MIKSYINNFIQIGKCTNKIWEFALQMDDVIDEFDIFLTTQFHYFSYIVAVSFIGGGNRRTINDTEKAFKAT
jgi:hypothetical protein